MLHVSIQQVQTELPFLLEQVRKGEELVVMSNEKPVAKVVSFTEPGHATPVFGSLKGKLVVSDNFNEPLDDLFREYYQ